MMPSTQPVPVVASAIQPSPADPVLSDEESLSSSAERSLVGELPESLADQLAQLEDDRDAFLAPAQSDVLEEVVPVCLDVDERQVWRGARKRQLDTSPESSSALVSVASIHSAPAPRADLPWDLSSPSPVQGRGSARPPAAKKQHLLFEVAKKYGMSWAIDERQSSTVGELGRHPVAHSSSRVVLSQGASVDIMSSLNNHLQVPQGNSVPSGYGALISSSSRRAKPFEPVRYQPIPMSEYSSDITELASILDKVPAAPRTSQLPPPVFTEAIQRFQYASLISAQGIAAIQILDNIPESVRVDRRRIHALIARLFHAGLGNATSGVGSEVRATRHTQLAGLETTARDALVHQPILGDGLYSDPSGLVFPIPSQPEDDCQMSQPRPSPSNRVEIMASPPRAHVRPSQVARRTWGAPDGGGLQMEVDKVSSPSPLDLSWRDRGNNH